MLVSAMQQSESAICIFMYCLPLGPPITTSHHPQSTPSHPSPHPICSLIPSPQSTKLSFCTLQSSPLSVCFTHGRRLGLMFLRFIHMIA